MADAYYVLSDKTRRREYDLLHAQRQSERTADPNASTNFFANFANMFSGSAGGAAAGAAFAGDRPNAEGVFGDVFEEASLIQFIFYPCRSY